MKKILTFGLCFALASLFAACGAELNPKTQGHLHSALEAKQDAFKACYENALERDRELQGPMELVLDVHEESGKVTKAKVGKTKIGDKKMKKCVRKASSDIELPEPPGVPVEGHYTLDFGFEE